MHNAKIKVFTAADFLLIAALIAAAVFFYPMLESGAGDTVVVLRDNTEIARYPLGMDKMFTVKGAAGNMTIGIENGRVRVVSSMCRRNVCVCHSPVAVPHDIIVCVPNHVVVEVKSSRKTHDTDADTF
jgi:hypothetical protein